MCHAELVGAGNCVTLCDLGVFVDQAAEPVAAQDAHSGHFGRRMLTPGGRVLLQGSVRPMDVIVVDVLAEDQPQVPSAGDQPPVGALAPGAGHPAFRDRIRAGRLERGLDDPRRPR